MGPKAKEGDKRLATHVPLPESTGNPVSLTIFNGRLYVAYGHGVFVMNDDEELVPLQFAMPPKYEAADVLSHVNCAHHEWRSCHGSLKEICNNCGVIRHYG